MQKDTIAKISSILQCRKIPEGVRIRLENHQEKPILLSQKSLKKRKIEKTLKAMSPVSRRDAKNTKEGIFWGF